MSSLTNIYDQTDTIGNFYSAVKTGHMIRTRFKALQHEIGFPEVVHRKIVHHEVVCRKIKSREIVHSKVENLKIGHHTVVHRKIEHREIVHHEVEHRKIVHHEQENCEIVPYKVAYRGVGQMNLGQKKLEEKLLDIVDISLKLAVKHHNVKTGFFLLRKFSKFVPLKTYLIYQLFFRLVIFVEGGD